MAQFKVKHKICTLLSSIWRTLFQMFCGSFRLNFANGSCARQKQLSHVTLLNKPHLFIFYCTATVCTLICLLRPVKSLQLILGNVLTIAQSDFWGEFGLTFTYLHIIRKSPLTIPRLSNSKSCISILIAAGFPDGYQFFYMIDQQKLADF